MTVLRPPGAFVAAYSRLVDNDLAKPRGLPDRLATRWLRELSPQRRQAVLAWGAFAVTFGCVRALTHTIRHGHGPSRGGLTLDGEHLHHYNLGILGLAGIGALLMYSREDHRYAPATAIGYGTAGALIVDEAALLLDLQDVYWARQGRSSVDLAVGIIGVGGVALAGCQVPALMEALNSR